MDENTWRFAQLMMWIIGIQTTLLISVLGFMWRSIFKIGEKIEATDVRLSKKIDDLDVRLSKKIDDLSEKVNVIDKRVIRIETMLHVKDCCMLKDENHLKKVE